MSHTIVDCPRWIVQRNRFISKTNISSSIRVTLELIVQLILSNNEYWRAFNNFAFSIIKAKEEEERFNRRVSLP